MIEKTLASEMDARPLTKWKTAPTLRELKQDLSDAKPIHQTHVAKITGWLDNLNVTGKAIIKTPYGN